MAKTRIGYIRLTDAAPLIVARGLGAFVQEKVRVDLVPLRSWAEVRDRLITGDIQASHCLAGIPLASQAGLFGPQAKLVTAFTLNHYGNAITLARPLAQLLATSRQQFVDHVRERRAQGKPLVLASVFPVSKHEYELRHWIASLGLDPQVDMRLVVVSPPETASALHQKKIDGYCVGEPWNTRAIVEGWGEAVATSVGSGLPGTEKVLAVREDFLETESHAAVLRALSKAAQWLSDPAHVDAAIELVAPYVGRPLAQLRPALGGTFVAADREPSNPVFVRFDAAINRPDAAHADWYVRQMQAAGQVGADAPVAEICARAFRAGLHDALVRRS
jgi:ABC-type nitrate/sulfonate/bicarbonate transport system substrate-binding protein